MPKGITGGSLGSRKLRSPKGTQVRPTPGRVKESLFSILIDRLDGARVLDLFAGTGAIGFEAASRGAARVVSVESQREIAQAIEEAAKDMGVNGVLTVFPAPAERALYRLEGPCDIVFSIRHTRIRCRCRSSACCWSASYWLPTRWSSTSIRPSGSCRRYPGIPRFAKKSTAMSGSPSFHRKIE